MKRLLHIFGHLLVLAIFLGAAWLLYDRLRQYTFQQICDAILGIGWWDIAGASLLTVLNFGILVGYDWFAVRWVVKEKLPLSKIAVASFSGYAFSYNFGATFFGTSIRYRLYSAWGVPLVEILELLVILGLTFWFGLFALAGVLFVVDPIQVPQQVTDAFRDLLGCRLPLTDTFWLGIVLLIIALGYVILSWTFRKPIRIRGVRIPFPPPKLTFYQIVIACGDLMVAAAVLHAILPPMEGGYFRILGVFMLAYVTAVLSHVPGGYGVFESLFMVFFPHEQGPAVFASLIVFRIIYYWIPLLIAAAMLGWHELVLLRGASNETPQPAGQTATVEKSG